MSNQTDLKLLKWPFFLGDAVLLGFAYSYFLYAQHNHAPLGHWEGMLFLLSGVVGAVLAVTPFVMEYQAAVKMVETGAMVSTLGQIQNLEAVAGQISAATAQWQGVQEHSGRTATAAKEIAERMGAEVAAFTEFMQKANDGEKTNLRLEVEKLRRAEGEWLQIIVRMLDHTYALYQAAVRSGQPGLIEQVGQFQSACRDVARRIGLVPFIPAVNEPFDPVCHQSADAQAMAVTNAKIQDTVATGYTYQGQLIRPALVSLQNPAPATVEVVTESPESVAALPEVNGKALKKEKAKEIEEQTLL